MKLIPSYLLAACVALVLATGLASPASADDGARPGTGNAAAEPAPLPTSPFRGTLNTVLAEGFDDIDVLPGWVRTNNSSPLGSTDWFQGNPGVFPAHAGVDTAYIGANFNNTTGGSGTISNWLITPELPLNLLEEFSFWTRVPAGGGVFPDRLEVRMNVNNAGSNVGTLATDVGDFDTLLLSINPDLDTTSYPEAWTQFTITGFPGATGTGRIAFRYFVTSAGPSGANSNFVGIDTVEALAGDPPPPLPEPQVVPSLSYIGLLLLALIVGGFGYLGLRRNA